MTERYTLSDAFPHEIYDNTSHYGQYTQLIGRKEACVRLNDYDRTLKYRDKEIEELKEENERLKKEKQQLYRIESRLRVRIKKLEEELNND